MRRINRRDAILALLPVTVVVVIYARVVGFDFVTWDDYSYIVGNPYVRDGLTADNVRWALTGFHSGNWHPLTWWAHMLDVSLWGLQRPGAHHLVSVGLHGLNAALLFLLMRRTGVSVPLALLAALLFAAHPLRVESVAWVAERKDLLAALFWLLGMHAYLGYAAMPRAGTYLLTTFLFAAALAAKPVAVSFPLACLIVDVWLLERPARLGSAAIWPLLREKLPWLAMALATGMTVLAAQKSGGALDAAASLSLGDRAGLVSSAYGWYLARFFWPVDLSFFYPQELVRSVPVALASAVVLVGISWICWSLRRACPQLLMGWAWYVVVMLPMSGIIKVGGQAWADRYAYLPLIGVAWGLVAAIDRLLPATAGSRPRRIAAAVALAFVAAQGFVSWRQVPVWRDTGTLTAQALAIDSRNGLAQALAGDWAARRGRLDDAEKHAMRALALSDQAYVREKSFLTLGIVSYQRGDYVGARAHLLRHVELRPDSTPGLLNLAQACIQLGDLNSARQFLGRLLVVAPRYPETHNAIGVVHLRSGKLAEAAASFARALALDPGNPKALLNLGDTYLAAGDPGRARVQYEALLASDPVHGEARRRLIEMAGAR